MKYKHNLRTLLSVLCAFWTLMSYGQDTLPIFDYSEEQTYEIGQLEVVGAEYADKNALRGLSGLKVGNKITIPGRAIPDAVKAIYGISLFNDVQIVATKVVGDVIFLEIRVQERPRYLTHTYRGVPRSMHEPLTDIVKKDIRRSSILTENAKNNLRRDMESYFHEKGYLDAQIDILEEPFGERKNAVKLVFDIDRGKRVKISKITFHDNATTDEKGLRRKLRSGKLRRKLKNTKQRPQFLSKSKFVRSEYEVDKKSLISYYQSLGLRDAKVVDDSVYRDDKGHIRIDLIMDEGPRYYFRNISWVGNTIYPDVTLATVLGIQKGEIYNPELLEKQLRFSQDSRDVSSLYLDEGYLFFNVDAVEVTVDGDSVDLEMQIYEGPQATIDEVVIRGNDRTHEHVIRRVLRTHPGEKFSRSDIIRSQREILNLGYFDPESLGINTPVNQAQGTVDIIYDLVERPSDQLELSAGYTGAANLIGTLGVTFNNFSTRRMSEKGAWRPVPMGDGQRLSLRGQSNGSFFRSVNFSFTEPWFGGRRPNALSVGGYWTSNSLGGIINKRSAGYTNLRTLAGYIGLGKQLKFPDDYFFLNAQLQFENQKLVSNALSASLAGNLFSFQGQSLRRGSFNNFHLALTVGRSSINEPLFPTRGSRFSLAMQFTPPYSLFREDNFWVLSEEERAEAIEFENIQRNIVGLGPMNEFEEQQAIFNAESAERFNYLEYHKWKFTGEWFNKLVGKLVLRSSIKMGFLGYYDRNVGVVPFERYRLGGDGLSNQNAGIQGLSIIRLRGYEESDVADKDGNGQADDIEDAVVYNKYEMELRYPISTNPNSTIYVQAFVEGGNSWTRFGDYSPFDMRRSVGLGLRVFLPVFGLIGFDYSWGFDKPALIERNAGIGQYGKFGLVIGFEPE